MNKLELYQWKEGRLAVEGNKEKSTKVLGTANSGKNKGSLICCGAPRECIFLEKIEHYAEP